LTFFNVELQDGECTDNPSQDIVEIVGQTSCQSADCFHFLGLEKLLLHPLFFGDIANAASQTAKTVIIVHRNAIVFSEDVAAILAGDLMDREELDLFLMDVF